MSWLDDIISQADNTIQTHKHALSVYSKTYSDIVDNKGYHYVDLVMEGGGMHGMALIGYTYTLEQMGIRFRGIGGTSAGAINAIALAAADKPQEQRSVKILPHIAQKEFSEFIDGGFLAEKITDAIMSEKSLLKTASLSAMFLASYNTLKKHGGINPGDEFLYWMKEMLHSFDVNCLKDLNDKMQDTDGIMLRGNCCSEDRLKNQTELFKMAVVTTDISTETKVDLPAMADLYFESPQSVNPAIFARMSMSVPGFFYNFELEGLSLNEQTQAKWESVGYDTEKENGLPEMHKFVDGGITSNFPIDIFHAKTTAPQAPTFGVKLSTDNRRHDINNVAGNIKAMFTTARHSMDYTYIRKNPDYGQIVKIIDIPEEHYHWLDFNMTDDQKQELFMIGVNSAIEFLNDFEWRDYWQFRASLLEDHTVDEHIENIIASSQRKISKSNKKTKEQTT